MLKIDRIIDYSGFSKDSNGVFYLSESDLDKVAENIILQLDATFLFEPRPIPVLDWIEDGVFGNKYDYKDLVVPKAFGLTSFHDDAVFARDSESGLLVHKVAEVFNVSKFAAGIRLRQQKYITNYPDY